MVHIFPQFVSIPKRKGNGLGQQSSGGIGSHNMKELSVWSFSVARIPAVPVVVVLHGEIREMY